MVNILEFKDRCAKYGAGISRFFVALAVFLPSVLFAETLQDPTRPIGEALSQVSAPASRLKLESILMSTGRKLAVINGQTVAEGETVDGIKITKIYSGKVDVVYKGKPKTLTLVTSIKTARP